MNAYNAFSQEEIKAAKIFGAIWFALMLVFAATITLHNISIVRVPDPILPLWSFEQAVSPLLFIAFLCFTDAGQPKKRARVSKRK